MKRERERERERDSKGTFFQEAWTIVFWCLAKKKSFSDLAVV